MEEGSRDEESEIGGGQAFGDEAQKLAKHLEDNPPQGKGPEDPADRKKREAQFENDKQYVKDFEEYGQEEAERRAKERAEGKGEK